MKGIIAIFCLVLSTFWACQSERSESLDSFQLHPEFAIEQVATEPLVFDPVDLEFDQFGKAYVLEMPGYPFGEEQSRIVRLEDMDQDGLFDLRTVFSDSLGVASALLPYKEGWLVAAPPDLLYLKDTDADGIADLREVVLTGFSEGNLQHNFNGLTYGLDNWIYSANGGNSGNVYWPDQPTEQTPLRGNDFRIDPELKRFELIGASSGGFELGINSWGHIFETHNLDHISHLAFPSRYIEHLPGQNRSLANISGHDRNGLARIFPIGTQEARVNHPEQAGYFSGASGITHYGGGAFPDAFEGNMFIADVVLNVIHRDIIEPDGASFSAKRGREKAEFLASPDRSFRPVNMTVGPDGALYLLDMHRQVIEHPEWIPDEIEADLDLEAGKEKGRIYRIVPKGVELPFDQPVNLDNTKNRIAALKHANQWWRNTAQRLLIEYRSDEAVPELKDLFNHSSSALARLHALWTMQTLSALEEATLIKALQDDHPAIRENALIISEQGWHEQPKVIETIIALASDSDSRVRMQTALSLGWIIRELGEYPDEFQAAQIQIADKDINDPHTRLAILSGVQSRPVAMMDMLLHPNALYGSDQAAELLRPLARSIGMSGNEQKVKAVLEALSHKPDATPSLIVGILNGLSQGWKESPHPNKKISGLSALGKLEDPSSVAILTASWQLRDAMGLTPPKQLENALRTAEDIVLDSSGEIEKRLEYLAFLELQPFQDREAILFELLNASEPEALQLAAMSQLRQAQAPTIASQLITLWPSLGPKAKMRTGDILLYQSSNHDRLLTALERGTIQLGEMNLHLERRRELLFSDDADIKRRAEALFSDAGIAKRKDALAQMQPALTLKGEAKSGVVSFEKLCASCHRLGDQGEEVGPDLTDVFNRSSTYLIQDILDPNAAVDTKYINHTVVTTNGIQHTGIVSNETDMEVTLKAMGGAEITIPRSQIKSFRATGLSLMPEGLEASMTHQEMADLLAYLQEYR